MALVPAPQRSSGPVVWVLRMLFGADRRRHESIKWDTNGRCQRAICGVCDREVGVSTAGRLVRHGPVDKPACRGTGGPTTFPTVGPANARAAMTARNNALAGRRRPRTKR